MPDQVLRLVRFSNNRDLLPQLRGLVMPARFITLRRMGGGGTAFQLRPHLYHVGLLGGWWPIPEQYYTVVPAEGDLADGWCNTCSCRNGQVPEWSTPIRTMPCFGAGPTPCACGHFVCRECLLYKPDIGLWDAERGSCTECSELNTAVGLDTTVLFNQLLIDVRGATVLPFHYAPNQVFTGTTYRTIGPAMRERLRRDISIAIWEDGRQAPILVEGLGHATYMAQFNHYHNGCWGNINTRRELENGGLVEALRDRLQEDLQLINASSYANREPSGLPSATVMERSLLRASASNPEGNAGWTVDPVAAVRRQRLLRQAALGLRVPEGVALAGLGGVGWNLGRSLLLAGVSRLLVGDNDRLEVHNSNRLDVYQWNVEGRTEKALAFSERFAAMIGAPSIERFTVCPNDAFEQRDGAQAVSWREYLNSYRRQFVGQTPVSYLVDTTDNLLAQEMYWQIARALTIPYVRVGYDGGWHVTVTSERSPAWELDPTRGYAVPAWIAGAEFAALAGVMKLCMYPDLEFSGDIRDLIASDQFRAFTTMQAAAEAAV